jgi:hypothetical protein
VTFRVHSERQSESGAHVHNGGPIFDVPHSAVTATSAVPHSDVPHSAVMAA